MPLFQYFAWVGSFLLAALFATNWCCFAPPAPRSDVSLDQKINIRIHTDHKRPERVVLDTTRSMLAREAKADAETAVGRSETPVQAERQPFDAFAEMAIPVRPCFRPPCFADQVADRGRACKEAQLELARPSITARQGPYFPQSASQAARKKLTRSRTKAGNSLRSSFAPSPIKARIIIGSRMRSMKICAVERLRLWPKGPLEPRESA